MKPNSLRTRGVVFAFLFGPPRVLTREDGVAVSERVCKALGVDDLTFKYGMPPGVIEADLRPGAKELARPFSIQMERRMGAGQFSVTLDSLGMNNPIRLLVQYTWPPSPEHAYQDFDSASEAAFGALGGNFQKILAETRIRSQVEAQGGNAISFLTERTLRLSPSGLANLEAPPNYVALVLETPPGDPTEVDQLHQPKREIHVEVLREDPRSVYIELVSQWAQLAVAPGRQVDLSPQRIRQFEGSPSEYLRNSMEYMTDMLLPLFSAPQS